jgi:hypothetical protein
MITDYHASYYAHELSRVGGTPVSTALAVRCLMHA